MPGDKEHFGFDALSDTSVIGNEPQVPRNADTVPPMPDGSWKALATGEILFRLTTSLGFTRCLARRVG